MSRVTSAALSLALELNQMGKDSANAWHIFLEAHHEGAGETVMSSPLGLAVQIRIIGTIEGDRNGNDASARRQKSSRGAGFPIRG